MAEGRAGDEWILPLDAPSPAAAVDLLKDFADEICGAWEDAVVEDTAAGEFAHSTDSLNPGEDSELCVYRDLESARQWQAGDSSAGLHNSMIQISLGSQGIRLITDDWRDGVLAPIVHRLGNVKQAASLLEGEPANLPGTIDNAD
jgi:hypothetical protein